MSKYGKVYQRSNVLNAPGRPAPYEALRDSLPANLAALADKDAAANSLYYSQMLNAPPDIIQNIEPIINEELFGTPLSGPAANAIMREQAAGRSFRERIVGSYHKTGVGMVESLAGMGRLASEAMLNQRTRALRKPLFFMKYFPEAKSWAEGNLDQLDEWSEMMGAGVRQYYKEHPAEGLQLQPGLGFVETLGAYITDPINILQGMIESTPLMLEGILGTIIAGSPGAITMMALPISGEVYSKARNEGTDILPAAFQSILTGVGEAVIENWTLSRKLGLAIHAREILGKGAGRVLWEANKAFWRGTAEEGSQEFNRNFWRWVFTDRTQAWGENVAGAAGAGGLLELSMAGVFHGVGYVYQGIGKPVSKEEQLSRLEVLEGALRKNLTKEQFAEVAPEIAKVREDVLNDVYVPEEEVEDVAAGVKAKSAEGAAVEEEPDISPEEKIIGEASDYFTDSISFELDKIRTEVITNVSDIQNVINKTQKGPERTRLENALKELRTNIWADMNTLQIGVEQSAAEGQAKEELIAKIEQLKDESMPPPPEGAVEKWPAENFINDIYKNFAGNPLDRKEVIINDTLIRLRVIPNDNRTVELYSIRAIEPQQGNASKAIETLKQLADKYNIRLSGEPEPFGKKGLTKTKLFAWYKKHGFIKQGKNVVYTPKTRITEGAAEKQPIRLTDGSIIHPSARTKGKTQVTRFTEEGEPAGHDEYDTIEQALIDNYTDIDHPVFKQLSRLAEKAATWFGEALANKNVKPLRQGKEYVYISTMRPLAGVSIEGIIADVDGGSKSVLWRDAPVSLNDQKHLDLIPYSKEAVSGAVQDYSDATLAKSQRPLAKIEKPEKPAAEAEEFETPEEARTEEAKLEVEAAEKVRPNLYIGNVTPGMKARIADAMDWSAKDIRDFTEGGWKVKRTPIEMTRSEAEEYLNWLEADLNRRLEENKINTRNEMAWANADWGDVKALRKSLGLEVGPRPWYIVPGTKDVQVTRTEDLKKEYANLATLNKELRASEDEDRRSEIEDAISAQEEVIIQMEEAAGKSAKVLRTPGQAITAATRPSSLEESNMTVQEVLGAVMKRGARMAKMAYAAGRRELREAQRIKARAKARMNSAIADIKRKVPSSVDLLYRDAIDAIKSQIDPHLRAEETLKKRQSLRDYIKAHPDMAALVAPDKMRSFLKTLDMLGKKSFNEYTIGEFEDIAAQINKLRSLGSLRRKLEIHEYERSKQRDIEKLKKGSVKIQNLKLLRPKEIGGKLTREERAVNIYVKARNFAAQKWRSVATPMDVLFDLLDGTKEYKGPNFKLFKEGLDKQWSRYFDLRDEVCQPILQLGRDFGMNEGNYERIGVYAALQQDNGRKKLLDTGYDEQQIDAVQLTKEEMRIYEKMREAYDSLVPEIEAVMRDVYNEKFVRERNYFPMLTDWEAMTSNEIQDIFTDKLIELPEGIKKNVPRKFTIERIGGTQKIKINALEIFLQHIDSASYLIEMGAEVKRLSEIAATAEYADAVGNVGQAEVRSWLDLMSRKGGVQYGKTIPALDTFRRHIGAAVIGFRLSTALVNATPLVDGAGIIGNYAFKGASDIATSPEWRAFVLKNFPEYRDRVGGDIEFLEFGTTTIEKAEEIGFYPLKYIDGLAAASVAVGAYQKYMIESGLDVDLSKPNAEAITYAQRVMRRTQSSAFYKDLPSVFTRGTFSGNRSIDRLLFQFQSFMVNRWSLIEHDMIRSGIKTGNVGKAMNIFFYLALAGFAEMGIRRLTKELIALLTGEDTEDWSETFTRELVVNTLQNIPFVSQGVSTYNYGNVPVPAISLIEQMTERFNRIKRTKSPSKRRLQALELLLLSSGVVAGVPGTVQALEIVESKRKR